MAKAKPVLHTELFGTDGREIGAADEVELSDKQLDWLADLFAPILEKTLQKGGKVGDVSGKTA